MLDWLVDAAARERMIDSVHPWGQVPTPSLYRPQPVGLTSALPRLGSESGVRMGVALRARQLIDGASFGPEALKAIGQAFDGAWAEIAHHFGNVPVDIDNARFRLANAILSVADEDSRDVEVLKRAALQRMALDYRR
jgi:hypothetical protein